MLSVFNLKSGKYGREFNHSKYIRDSLTVNEPLPNSYIYNKSVGDISIINRAEIINNLKFKREHTEKYIKDVKREKYYVQGNTTQDERNDCHIRYNPYKCKSQGHWGKSGFDDRARYRHINIYARIIHSMTLSGEKAVGYDNVFYGSYVQSATKDGSHYGSQTSGKVYVVFFKDPNFESKEGYTKKYHHRYLIFFYNSKENAINKINPIDFFEIYHQHTKYPPASIWLFFTIFIAVIMVLLAVRAFAMLKYGCEKNWIEFFFGRCGSVIVASR